MIKEAIFHQPMNQYAYHYDDGTVHIMIQSRAYDLKNVQLIWADPYNFKEETWQYELTEVKHSGRTKTLDYWKIEIKPPYRRMRYGFRCEGANGEVTYLTGKGHYTKPPEEINAYFCLPYIHKVDAFKAPAWVKDTVWYQIFPERFGNGDPSLSPENAYNWDEKVPESKDFFGGDFQGILNHLDYLEELGINGIYLCPIFKAGSNHKYDTIDYFEIDPQFGDKETFRKLVDQCHERGIKVMLDAVFNHSGYYFEPFQDVLKNNEQSPYKDWFHIWDFPVQTTPYPNYDTFAFVSNMPKLNTANPEVKDYLLKVARYWIEEFNIDGWRLDVANEIDHEFWRAFRKEVKSANPDVYILGEVWHDSMPWLRGDQFDAVMNYPFTENVLELFDGTSSVSYFKDQMMHLLHMYPDHVQDVQFNLLDSHDTARIKTLVRGEKERVKLMYAFQLTFLGSPCLYYGDEIGLEGGEEPESRGCMIWDEEKQDLDLLHFVKQLIELRKSNPALGAYGQFKFIDADEASGVLVYSKENDAEQFVIVMNTTANDQTIDMPTALNKRAEPLFTEKNISQSDGRMKLEPFAFGIYKRH
ncbi:Glycosidase [Pelagirhabdus alkalitolerans]|uniref:Glycosidase n=1 Tax=Pelagirhabdus alkalitolerans TaxID=1612202 RepID=A0A1G6GM55_9BACI|nr:alpha-glycosidase [Pelagirhabdus alkalitolerans]SDB82795.1 Glycosidase [Pelagirhabdus alkalitolerans]